MCVSNPQPFHSDIPITAFKVMLRVNRDYTRVRSLWASDIYEIGKEYDAEIPKDAGQLNLSGAYKKGFHAYEHIWTAQEMCKQEPKTLIVEVELSDLTFRGTQHMFHPAYSRWKLVPVYVANKCRFNKFVELDFIRS